MTQNYTEYGILSGDHIDANSGASTILGSLGSFNAITGSGTVTATDQTNIGPSINTALTNAQNDYIGLQSFTPDVISGATDIGGMTFIPGVYQFTAPSVTLGTVVGNNTITLDGNSTYIFQFPNGDFSTDSTLASVSINLINGARSTQIYWLINGNFSFDGSANITSFLGLVLCQGNISLNTSNSTNLGSMVAFSGSSIITLNANEITATSVQAPREVNTPNYINIESTLADNEAITISASNTAGGILIEAGFGGINIETTNSISLNSAAASNFTTSAGNLTLQATTGLLNVDGGSGLNIGNAVTSSPINVGTSANAKVITIGNLTSTTEVAINTGTGGFNTNTASGGTISLNANGSSSNFTVNSTGANQDLTLALTGANASRVVLSSTGTGTDSIFFNTSVGGLTGNITGPINFVSNSSSPSAFNIDTTATNGGISMTAGNQGVVINSIFGIIAIGNTNSPVIFIGNNTANTFIFNRFGSSGFLKSQIVPTPIISSTITISQLLIDILQINNGAGISTLNLPTAVDVVNGILGIQDNDSIDFHVINQDTITVTVIPDVGSVVGNAAVTTLTSGSFRLSVTSVGTPAYTVYRLS